MAQQEEIVLWLDRRWKKAIERHLKDETLQEHLENVLDELCNRLPAHEYERISRAIQAEAAAQRAEEEAARTYAAYHVVENGQEWYFKTTPGEELLDVCKKLRSYITTDECCARSVHQNVCRRPAHYSRGVRCTDCPSHAEHRQKSRRV